MGGLYSYFFGPIEREEPDPVTGLTATQRKLIKQCWDLVERNILEIGVEIMITFLREYPKYQGEFPKFKGRDLEELVEDRHFHAHCLNIMSVFTQAVQFIDDAELCAAGLRMAGERHGRRGQILLPFDLLQPIVTKILKVRLGDKCSSQVSETLDIAIALIFKEIKHGIDEHTVNKEKTTL